MTANLEQLATTDRFYYNAVLTNPSSAYIADPQPARFLDTRAVPLIRDCSDYHLTIARLSILGATAKLPLLLPQIAEGIAQKLLAVFADPLKAPDERFLRGMHIDG
jgi:hypothetical protein